ncbi:carbohydrate porin [Gammaproteobacteria bacterium]|nr:carbohydrate porin [Gammaproteobacteria bacterium]
MKLKFLFIVYVLSFCQGISFFASAETIPNLPIGLQSTDDLGGPSSIPSQIMDNNSDKKPIFRYSQTDDLLAPWYSYKKRLNNNLGLQLGLDYQTLYQYISSSITNNRDAAGGIARLYGKWALINRNSKNQGALLFKVENRHKFANITPTELGFEAGYNGITGVLYNNVNTVLNTLYWEQFFFQNKLSVAIGRLDPTDFIDILGYANPWTTFQNLSTLLNTSIAIPDSGTGIVTNLLLSNTLNLGAGIYDANSTIDNIAIFSQGVELFKHIELGFSPNRQDRFAKRINLTLWGMDARKNAGLPKSYGIAFSSNWLIFNKWLPFIRLGQSKGKAQLFNKSITTGIGYLFSQYSDVFGLGFNWGQPSSDSINTNQYTTELFLRLQLTKEIAITPDIQWIVNPAFNSKRNNLLVGGLRGRITL